MFGNRRYYLPPEATPNKYILLNRSIVQVIPTGVGTAILFDVVNHIDDIYSYNPATGVVTLSESGIYNCNLITQCAAGAVGERNNVILYNDGIAVATRTIWPANLPNIISRLGFNNTIVMQNSGTITFQYFQSQGVNLNLNGGVNITFATIIKIGDL